MLVGVGSWNGWCMCRYTSALNSSWGCTYMYIGDYLRAW